MKPTNDNPNPYGYEAVPGCIHCSHCGVVVDILPPDPLSPYGFLRIEKTVFGIRGTDSRTGWVFHECQPERVFNGN